MAHTVRADSHPRSTRDRPAKAPLSRDVIVDEAVRILRDDGVQALTMRRVAAGLDTGAGSLYVYVTNREALLAAVFDRILANVQLVDPDPSRWRPQLLGLLRRLRDTLIAHPGIAAAMMVDPPRSDAVMTLLENLLALLLEGGMSPQDAVWSADVLTAQVTSAAIEAETRPASDVLVDDVLATVESLPVERYPLIRRHAAELVAGSVEERFNFAVDALLDGVLSRTPATTARRRPSPRSRPSSA